jgi:hypothetical protein
VSWESSDLSNPSCVSGFPFARPGLELYEVGCIKITSSNVSFTALDWLNGQFCWTPFGFKKGGPGPVQRGGSNIWLVSE